ncbi:hypothetical protein TNCV_879021 [Trichonephila clavipes]|nr:hypothetical protein TNCV_879021 [Trichonephila clavipes]
MDEISGERAARAAVEHSPRRAALITNDANERCLCSISNGCPYHHTRCRVWANIECRKVLGASDMDKSMKIMHAEPGLVLNDDVMPLVLSFDAPLLREAALMVTVKAVRADTSLRRLYDPARRPKPIDSIFARQCWIANASNNIVGHNLLTNNLQMRISNEKSTA